MVSMSSDHLRALDGVELTAASGRWPRGTEGTILELFGTEAALVEVADERGHTLEELELPLGMLRPLGPSAQEQLPLD
jgi:hypothetical protein